MAAILIATMTASPASPTASGSCAFREDENRRAISDRGCPEAQMGRLELAFLSPDELDDQAIAEIAALMKRRRAHLISASSLIRMAASGNLVVARGPCGQTPEIVGFAACERGEDLQSLIVAVDPGRQEDLAQALTRRLTAPPISIFRRRDRAPLGLERRF